MDGVWRIVASWKKFTAREFVIIGGQIAANQEIGVPGPVWHREYWDRYVRDEHHFRQAIEYIHQNPVKAGLVVRAENWPWSSARLNKGEIGESAANREIGVPGVDRKTADREIGVPRATP